MDISLFRAIASQYQELRSVHSVATLNTISSLIEEQVLNNRLAVDLYAGFGLLSHFSDQIAQYTRLGAVCRRVFVFGVPNVELPSIPGVEYVGLSPTAALSRERFLLVNTSSFWTVLLAQEVVSDEAASDDRSPVNSCPYDGGWFYDEELVERVSLLLSQALGTYYQPVRERNYLHQSAHIAAINSRLLVQMQDAQLSSDRRSMQLSTLQQFSAILLQHQPLPCILRDSVQILSMIFGASEAIVALNLHDSNFMVVSATGNVSTNQHLSSLGEGASGQAFRESKCIAVWDVRTYGHFDPLMPTAETLLAAPIKGRTKVFGVVTVGGKAGNRWDKEDSQTVMAIASMLAVIIEQKAQVTSDIVIQLRRARHLEQLMRKLRKPMASLLVLQNTLRDEANLTPSQLETLSEIETLYSDLALTLGVPTNSPRPKQSPQQSFEPNFPQDSSPSSKLSTQQDSSQDSQSDSNDSKLPPPPKTAPIFGGRLRAP